jgi:hypothetical protein
MNNYDCNNIHTVLSESEAAGVYVWAIVQKRSGEPAVVIGTKGNSKILWRANSAMAMADIAVDGINGWLWLVEDFGVTNVADRQKIAELMREAAMLPMHNPVS